MGVPDLICVELRRHGMDTPYTSLLNYRALRTRYLCDGGPARRLQNSREYPFALTRLDLARPPERERETEENKKRTSERARERAEVLCTAEIDTAETGVLR